MLLIAVILGLILIIAAIRNTQGALFDALGADVPGYIVWAAAVLAIGVLGYIPNLKPVSKGLLILVLVVIFLQNYRAVLSGFGKVSQNG